MPLVVVRHARVERLVEELAVFVREAAPADPFEPLPIVVGSRNVERWLRQELASELGIAANLVFPGPRAAFRGAVRALLDPASVPRGRYWEPSYVRGFTASWEGSPLTFEVLAWLRRFGAQASFAHVRGVVGTEESAVAPRELGFAREVAHTLEKLLTDRPHEALSWLAAPARAPEPHRWLAELLRALHDARREGSAAQALAALVARSPRGLRKPLAVFGLGSPSPHDRHHLQALAAHMPVHLFMLAPTREWVGDERSRHELLREAKRAKTGEEREAVLRTLDRANVLLAASGLVTRDTQAWIEETGLYVEHSPAEEDDEPARETLLARVQTFVAEAHPMPTAPSAAWQRCAHDGSLDVHACHGALRQCEALREALLSRFSADPTLEPRHVIVMTPDVATFGPLVQAVLARPVQTANGVVPTGLPVHVSDLGLRLENPLAEALVRVLELAGERVTAPRLLELVNLDPVRRAFALEDDDEAAIAACFEEAGLRWGWSAEDRAAHGQPASHEHTVAFALERLALGTLVDDAPRGALFGLEGSAAVAPAPLRTSEAVARFGKLAHALRTLEEVSRTLQAPRTLAGWAEALRMILDRCTAVSEEQISWRSRIESALDELMPAATEAPTLHRELHLERASVLALLEAALDLPGAPGGAYGGAITLCALEPMRAVPFRVVALVGLSEGAFPRQGTTPAWDPFARRLPGEPTRTALDRHLFLEALASAREALWLFGDGFEPQRGKAKPMSPLCDELLEVVAAHTGVPRGDLLRKHPLQPWSAGEGPDRTTHDSPWNAASVALEVARRTGRTRLAGLARTAGAEGFPPCPAVTRALPVHRFARELECAPRALLAGRLDLYLDDDARELEAREPLDPGDLRRSTLPRHLLALLTPEDFQAERAFDAAVRASRRRRLLVHARASGLLLPGARGEAQCDDAIASIESCLRALGTLTKGAAVITGDPLCATVGLLALHAPAPRSFTQGGTRTFAWLSPGNVYASRSLELWVSVLMAASEGLPVQEGVIFTPESTLRVRAPARHEARAHLEDLAAAYERSLAGPVLRVPELSFAVAEAAAKVRASSTESDLDAKSLVARALGTWRHAERGRGALDDACTAQLFGHLVERDLHARAEEILAAAEEVWRPALAALGACEEQEEEAP
jgi:exodeoxyribonuclease V gamma subunit